MRERLVLFGVLVAAAMLGAILVLPRGREARETSASASASTTQEDGHDGGGQRVPDYVHLDPRSSAVCGDGMVLVDGIYCPYVGHACTKFLIEERDVCQAYAPEVLCEGRLMHRRFCIDDYEYPNIVGVVPAVMVDWNDAKRACAVEGKRLCTAPEWEFACEGPQMWPYPYGIERDATACNIDRTYTLPEMEAFSDASKISEEVERLDKRVPSGTMARCISPFGVHDMTGNVDEWVVNENGNVDDKPFRSGLKGGYWGPIRARCRPMTTSHNEWFSFYQVGFRCCRDADGRALEPAPRSAHIPTRHRMEDPPPRPSP